MSAGWQVTATITLTLEGKTRHTGCTHNPFFPSSSAAEPWEESKDLRFTALAKTP